MKRKSYLSALVITAVLGVNATAFAEFTRIDRTRPDFPLRPGGNDTPPIISTPKQCSKLKSVGVKTVELASGRTMKLWYPTSGKEISRVVQGELKSTVVADGPLSECKFPLIVFSHGFGGCSTQSLFITEALASAGYVVAAPNHLDANCGSRQGLPSEQPFESPELWTSETYKNRRDDITAVLDLMLSSTYPNFVNPNRIGAVGHSLGGYTSLGVSGAWSDWLDTRVKAALLLSPYAAPFLESNTLSGLQVPTMYQGGTLDIGVTPLVKKTGGVYDSSPSPKYFLELKKAGHLAWTNAICGKETKIAKCLTKSSNARLILSYGIGFLDEYVAGRPAKVLKKKNAQLKDYRYDLGAGVVK